jgi:glycosyltransferase involved in cell wall biosynthesis
MPLRASPEPDFKLMEKTAIEEQTSAVSGTSRLPRVAVVCDLLQENWPSMDLTGDMLFDDLNKRYATSFQAERLRPAYQRHWAESKHGLRKAADTAERSWNRYGRYPLWLRGRRSDFDLFHVIDHSYAHLVHSLQADRTVVTCHDLDAFRCLMNPSEDNRSWAFRRMAIHVLSGLKKAAWVVCNSEATARELLTQRWIQPEKMSVAHMGVAPVFSPAPDAVADREVERLLASCSSGAILLHVGSTIPRKGINVLLQVFAEVKKSVPTASLLQAGGAFTKEQRELAKSLGIEDSLLVLPFLEERVLAAVYRKSTLLLLPSEREGFGLPLLEAMACGLPAVVTDISALREVGGEVALYCGAGDVEGFCRAVLSLGGATQPRPDEYTVRSRAGIERARQFSWSRCMDEVVQVYEKIIVPLRARPVFTR